MAKDYFQNLFKSTSNGDYSELFEGFTRRVSVGMNETISREVSCKEVKEAVFTIKPGNAPDQQSGNKRSSGFLHDWPLPF